MMSLACFVIVLGSGMAVRPENALGAEMEHGVVASILDQTTNADPRLALAGQQLLQIMSPNPEGEFTSMMDMLRDVLNKLLEESKGLWELAQANVQKEVDSFEDCHFLEPHYQNFDTELQDHAQCRQLASTLKETADACNSQKAALKDTMDIACKAYEDYKAADHSCPARVAGESTEDWLLKAKNEYANRYDTYNAMKKACGDATAAHDAVDCTLENSAYDEKEQACDLSYLKLETHSCDHATAASQLADAYDTCYEVKKTDYLDREAEMALETQRELNYRLAMRMLCLLDSITQDADNTTFTIDEDGFQVCADTREYDTTDLKIVWPDLPAQSPPVVPTAYPCNAEYLQRVNETLPSFADVPECAECAGMHPDYVTEQSKQYLLGGFGSDSCPPDADKIIDAASCESAAMGLGYSYLGTRAFWTVTLSGCMRGSGSSGSNVYFQTSPGRYSSDTHKFALVCALLPV